MEPSTGGRAREPEVKFTVVPEQPPEWKKLVPKNTPEVHKKPPKSPRVPQTAVPTATQPNVTQQPKPVLLSMDPLATLNVRGVEQEFEFADASRQIDDLEEVIAELSDVEAAYSATRKWTNRFSLMTARSSLTIQTVKTCFSMLKALLADTVLLPFDEASFEARIDASGGRIISSNQNYNAFKGEFIALHETVIGVDPSTFTLARLKAVAEDSQQLYTRMPALESDVSGDHEAAVQIKSEYESFEVDLFKRASEEATRYLQLLDELIKTIRQ
jgi:hypothetical protein